MKCSTVAACFVVLVPSSAVAWSWLSTPLPREEIILNQAEEAPPAQIGSDAGLCLAAIFEAEQRYNIPQHLLLAIGLQEAGYQSGEGLTVWPWTVNAAGEGRRFNSQIEALRFVEERRMAGVASIDLGCMQINLRWHPDAFSALAEGFNPSVNVDYAARFLRGLYDESGDWWTAAGRYHSYSSGPQANYLKGLERNLTVANARIESFAALASVAPDTLPYYAEAVMAQPKRRPVEYRTEGAIWGGELAGSEGARRSIYSAQDLEPILPNYLSPES